MTPWVWDIGRKVSGPVGVPAIGLEEADDVAIAEGKGGLEWRFSIDMRHMVGHDHAIDADFLVDPQARSHVHVAGIGKLLGEGIAAALDVAEVDVENLLTFTEPADDVADFLARIFEAFGHRALTEIEPVIGTFGNGNELLESFGRA